MRRTDHEPRVIDGVERDQLTQGMFGGGDRESVLLLDADLAADVGASVGLVGALQRCAPFARRGPELTIDSFDWARERQSSAGR
jgi:hypothetical protein